MTAATPQSRADSHNQQAIERALSLCLRHRHPVTLLAIAIFGSVIAQLYFSVVNAPNAFGGGDAAGADAAGEQ